MNNPAKLIGVAAVLILGPAPAAIAQFTGDTVSADYHWPDLGTILYPSGNAIVDPGVEFSDIGGFGIGLGPSVDFSDTSILVTFPAGWGLSGPGTFDGFVFTDFSDNDIASATVLATDILGFDDSHLSTDGNHVYADLLGLGSWGAGSSISIGVQFAPVPVPEPSTYAALFTSLGLVGLTVVGRRWK